jgi:hypothetical protein
VSGFLSYVRKHHIALLALFVAMGGTSYAAFKLPNNSVGAAQIKPNAVGTSELKNNTVGVSDLSDKAIASLRGLKGDTGAPGEKGAQGDKGAPGSDGAPGPPATWTSSTVAAAQGISTNSSAGTPLADLATVGPEVTVTVPASGLAEVYAQADFSSSSSNIVGRVGLSVDGNLTLVGCGSKTGVLFDDGPPDGTSVTVATSARGGTTNCGARLPGLASPVMVKTTPGSHQFKLVYSASTSDAGSTVTFSSRLLAVAPA